MDITQILTIFNLIFLVAGAAGAIAAFRHAKKTRVIEIQHDTIEALQASVEALESKVKLIEEENSRLTLVLETIQSALKQKGIVISIDGELVTFTYADGSTFSSTRRRTSTRKKPTA